MRQSKQTQVLARAVVGFGLVSGGLLSFASPAQADLTIVPIFDSTITSDPNAATIEATINTDISNIDSYIANPVTVTITFDETNSGLADSNTPAYNVDYSSYLTALETQQTLTSADTKALATLGVTGPSGPFATDNPVNGNTQILTRGPLLNALFPGQGYQSTGTVEFNPAIVNESRPGTNPNDYDLQSSLAHEIDEVLGIGGAGSNLNSVATNFDGETLASPPSPLDLFRYSAAGVRSYNTSNNVSSYFSIDGGNTDLVHFNQNGAADGSDYGDWGDGVTPADGDPNVPAQVQDAYGPPGITPDVEPNLGPNEITALDVVGWDLTPAGVALEGGTVPEPASLGVVALGAISVLGRRRRASK